MFSQVQGNVEHFQDNCEGVISWLDKETYYTAFVEGWGLYAENPLISETDVYDNNLMQKFGMLKWQVGIRSKYPLIMYMRAASASYLIFSDYYTLGMSLKDFQFHWNCC